MVKCSLEITTADGEKINLHTKAHHTHGIIIYGGEIYIEFQSNEEKKIFAVEHARVRVHAERFRSEIMSVCAR